MYVVVEPGQRSLMVADDIERMAGELGVPAVWVVANKVRGEEDLAFVREHVEQGTPPEGDDHLGQGRLAGWLPRDEHVVDADMRGVAVYDAAPEVARRVEDIARRTGLI
jgi:CO dehydrogenase nickel-insertion accessory protein CooC1